MPHRHLNHLLSAGFLCFTFAVRISSAGEDQIDFATQIRPILHQHCLECHGPEQREGGLLLTDRQAALLSNDSGRVGIVPRSRTRVS